MTDTDLIYQKIRALIQNAKLPSFAVFDFDNTCIVNDITEATFAYMARHNLFEDKNLLGGRFEDAGSPAYSKALFDNYWKLIEKDDIKEAYEFISKILSGFDAHEVSALVSKVIEFEGDNITTDMLFGRKIAKGIKPGKQIIKLIDLCKSNNIEPWIISASIEVLVKEAMKHFNIDGQVIGVQTSIINGKFTAQLKKPLSMFEGKVKCIKKYIDSKKIPLLGAGDSIYDLPMLEYCTTKVVVDRNNALTAKAKENNWFLIRQV